MLMLVRAYSTEKNNSMSRTYGAMYYTMYDTTWSAYDLSAIAIPENDRVGEINERQSFLSLSNERPEHCN